MRTETLGRIGALLAVLPMVVFWAGLGCDDTDELTGAVFRIEPEQATLVESGDTVVLQAIGGEEPFRWSVSDPSLGSVPTNSTDRTVTYVRAGSNGANLVTVTDSQGWTATATIIQEDLFGGLSIEPPQVALAADGDVVLFTARGGTPPYSWSVSVQTLGKIHPRGAAQALYVRQTAGNNTVILTDARRQVAVASVTQSAAGAMTIVPATASLSSNGEMVLFSVSGGSPPYTWRVSDDTRGTVRSQGTTQAIYTRLSEGNNVVTVTDRRGQAAIATITQTGLTITPSTASPAKDGETVLFTAGGGTPPYTWEVWNPTLGEISPQGASQAIYTRRQAGNNYVTVTDHAGHVAMATITQPLPGIPSISPASATVAADGDVVLFTASGGTPPYSWSVVRTGLGTVESQGPTQAKYTRTAAGDNQVLLEDAVGHAALASVRQP
ncbi:MAG: hypothetical protein ACUVWX_02780 [Kiritimatiellia bacterium]